MGVVCQETVRMKVLVEEMGLNEGVVVERAKVKQDPSSFPYIVGVSWDKEENQQEHGMLLRNQTELHLYSDSKHV